MRPRGVRARVVTATLALVALVALLLGALSFVLVYRSLRSDLVDAAVDRAGLAIGVLAPARLDDDPTLQELEASPLLADLRLGPDDGVSIDLGEERYASGFAFNSPPPEELTSLVDAGQLAYQWVDLGGSPYLVVGGRRLPDGPDFYLYTSAGPIEDGLGDLLRAEAIGAAALLLLAGLGAGWAARRVLRPVADASQAAGRMAAGDLSARLSEGSDDELGNMAAAFNRMAASLEETVARLQESEAAQRQFVADVSHELRTPLTALVNEAAMLNADLDRLPEADRRLVELLSADVGRMRRLVEELLEVSRLDGGSGAEAAPPADVRPMIDATVRARLPSASVTLPDDPIPVAVDAVTIDRIVGNLLDNAARHAPSSPVAVTLRRQGGTAVITVADRGPGVPADQLERIFDRFAKIDPARAEGGSGLGLSIARHHARRLGGDASAELRPGGGLLIEVTLPVSGSLLGSDPAETLQPDDVVAP